MRTRPSFSCLLSSPADWKYKLASQYQLIYFWDLGSCELGPASLNLATERVIDDDWWMNGWINVSDDLNDTRSTFIKTHRAMTVWFLHLFSSKAVRWKHAAESVQEVAWPSCCWIVSGCFAKTTKTLCVNQHLMTWNQHIDPWTHICAARDQRLSVRTGQERQQTASGPPSLWASFWSSPLAASLIHDATAPGPRRPSESPTKRKDFFKPLKMQDVLLSVDGRDRGKRSVIGCQQRCDVVMLQLCLSASPRTYNGPRHSDAVHDITVRWFYWLLLMQTHSAPLKNLPV